MKKIRSIKKMMQKNNSKLDSKLVSYNKSKTDSNKSLLQKIREFWMIADDENYMSLYIKILISFLLLFFLWAAFAPINSSIISSGEIVLIGNKKIISHLEGGIVEEVKIKEGQFVEPGQELIALNDVQIKAKIEQVLESINAAEFQKIATIKHISTLKQELKIVNELLKDSNSSLTRKLDLQKQLNESEGKFGELTSNILSLKSEYQAATDTLNRSLITSPVSGFVMNLKYHTIGGIIPPASEIMFIVPKDDKLIAEVKVKPQDIDLLTIGMEAKTQLSAYKSRLMPKLEGRVVGISADNFKNEMTGEIYFKAQIQIPESELKKLKAEVKLTPGMPITAFIITGSRTMLQYLLTPIEESAYKAFREE
jgi:multidrug efflux pump subunit AcrA (membrane-fusion protein)